MKSKLNYLTLGRTISHALRHDPEHYGLHVDSEGWVPVSDLLVALADTSPDWRELRLEDLEETIRKSEKVRHQIEGSRIRALYGHSNTVAISRETAEPPETLFHGTNRTAADRIKTQGLKPMSRQNVHLSVDQKTAYAVGRRSTPQPVILTVSAGLAHKAGVNFYKGNGLVWLSDSIPASFIEEPEASSGDK